MNVSRVSCNFWPTFHLRLRILLEPDTKVPPARLDQSEPAFQSESVFNIMKVLKYNYTVECTVFPNKETNLQNVISSDVL